MRYPPNKPACYCHMCYPAQQASLQCCKPATADACPPLPGLPLLACLASSAACRPCLLLPCLLLRFSGPGDIKQAVARLLKQPDLRDGYTARARQADQQRARG